MRAADAADKLLDSATDDIDRACLLASRSKELGAWLHALPVSTMRLRLEDEHLRVAVEICLGTPLYSSYHCQHCGEEVDIMGRRGLSCWRSEGRQQGHTELNNIIHHALASAYKTGTFVDGWQVT